MPYVWQASELLDCGLTNIYSQVLQDVLKRLEKSYKNFFRRVKNHETPGFPRFKSRNRYNSFTYPQKGFGLEDGKLVLSKIGYIKIKLHRPIEGTIKTCTIIKDLNRWYVCFSVEVEKKVLLKTGKSMGIDVGISTYATLSDGSKIDNPKWYKTEEKKLIKLQRQLASKVKGSNNRRQVRFVLAKQHRKVHDKRMDFLHKLSHNIVNNYDVINVEDLKISNMIQNHCLAKSISDASWSTFFNLLSYKAEEADKIVNRINPRNTSKTCNVCSFINKELTLNDRSWTCPSCGTIHDRDINASKNIGRVGTTQIYACREQVVNCSRSQEALTL